MNRLIAALSLLAAPAAAQVDALRLPPVDRCSVEEGIPELLASLKQAIDQRDPDLLMPHVSDDVLVDFGGGQGHAAFRQHWSLGRPADSELWDALRDALSHGCVAVQRTLVAPSLPAQLADDKDIFSRLLARPGAELRSAPTAEAGLLATLDWHLLEEIEDRTSGDWVAVRLSDGTEGFVRQEQTRSPFDYSVTLEKRDGRWLITGFVAGD